MLGHCFSRLVMRHKFRFRSFHPCRTNLVYYLMKMSDVILNINFIFFVILCHNLYCVIVSLEITSSWGQFHQHFTHNFGAKYFCAKILQSQNITREKLCKALLYKKSCAFLCKAVFFLGKMLWHSTSISLTILCLF